MLEPDSPEILSRTTGEAAKPFIGEGRARQEVDRLTGYLYRLRLDAIEAARHAIALLDHHGHGRFAPEGCSGCARLARLARPDAELDRITPAGKGYLSDEEFAEILEHLRGLVRGARAA